MRTARVAVQVPVGACESLINNGKVADAMAGNAGVNRTIHSRSVNGAGLSTSKAVRALNPGETFVERSGVADPNAGGLQRSLGFHAWSQTSQLKKSTANLLEGADQLLWEKSGSSASRAFSIKSTGTAAVFLALQPWVINVQNVPFAGTIRSRLANAMGRADADLPNLLTTLYASRHRKLRRSPRIANTAIQLPHVAHVNPQAEAIRKMFARLESEGHSDEVANG